MSLWNGKVCKKDFKITEEDLEKLKNLDIKKLEETPEYQEYIKKFTVPVDPIRLLDIVD